MKNEEVLLKHEATTITKTKTGLKEVWSNKAIQDIPWALKFVIMFGGLFAIIRLTQNISFGVPWMVFSLIVLGSHKDHR